jgi:hypothetical protein
MKFYGRWIKILRLGESVSAVGGNFSGDNLNLQHCTRWTAAAPITESCAFAGYTDEAADTSPHDGHGVNLVEDRTRPGAMVTLARAQSKTPHNQT